MFGYCSLAFLFVFGLLFFCFVLLLFVLGWGFLGGFLGVLLFVRYYFFYPPDPLTSAFINMEEC